MKLFRLPSLPSLSLKKRREYREFQKELDRPIRVSRYSNESGGGEIPRIISIQTLATSMDASSSSTMKLSRRDLDLSESSVLHW